MEIVQKQQNHLEEAMNTISYELLKSQYAGLPEDYEESA